MSDFMKFLEVRRGRRKSGCKCDLCEGNKEIRRILRRGDVKDLRRTVRGLSELLCNNRAELDMANSYIEDLRNNNAK